MSVKILLDNYNKECFPGQVIAGKIECSFKNKQNFKAIKITFGGRAKTKWNEKKSYFNPATKKSTSNTVLQYAEETYMNTEYYLVEGTDGNISLPAGKHFYPFSYTLPAQLPSSFEGKVGSIRYYIETVVERPWKFNYKAKTILNVVSPMDLNVIPRLRQPLGLSDDRIIATRTCCCRKVGSLTFKLSVPVTGYVPGEEINIVTNIHNTTNINVKCVKFKLVADYEYITHHPTTISKINSVVIVKCTEGSVGTGSQKSWTSTLLLPTDHLYPNLTACDIIDVRYTLKAEVVLPKSEANLQLEFPITIGSIAFSSTNTTLLDPLALIDPAHLPNANFSNANAPYPEMFNSTQPPPYYPEGGEPSTLKNGLLPHSFGSSSLPPGFIHSYSTLPEKLESSTTYPPSVDRSAPYPSLPEKSDPYPPSTFGSAPYPTPPAEVAPYPPSTSGFAQYPSLSENSVLHSSFAGRTTPFSAFPAEPASYPSSAGGGSAPYPTTSAESAPYPLLNRGLDPYSTERKPSETNSTDVTISDLPPSYEQSQQ